MFKNLRTRASVVALHEGHLLCVLLQDPVSFKREAFVPGGRVEAGESPAAAAARECREETGFDVVIEEDPERVAAYDFFWAGQLVACRTHFFRGVLRLPRQLAHLEDQAYNLGVLWVPRAEVTKRLAFHAAIAREVLALL